MVSPDLVVQATENTMKYTIDDTDYIINPITFIIIFQ